MVSLASLATAGGGGGGTAPTTNPRLAQVGTWPLGVDLYGSNTYKGAPISAAGFANLAAKGKVFAILKSSQGGQADGQFPAYYQRAADAGLIRGSYHFIGNKNVPAGPAGDFRGGTIQEQADLVLRLVPRLAPGDLAPALDLEDPDIGGRRLLDEGPPGAEGYSYRSEHGSDASKAGRTALLTDVQEFLDRIETALGRTPLIYTSVTWMDSDELGNPTEMSQYPLWTVNHGRTARFVDISVGGWGNDWDILQYGSNDSGGSYYSEPEIDMDGEDYDAYRDSLAGLRGLADMGRPAAAMTSTFSLVAHAEADGTMHLRTGPGWQDHNLSLAELFGAIADPDMVVSGNDALLFYRKDGAVMEARSQAGGPWNADAIDDGTAPVNNPRAVVDGAKRYVAYWGADDDWHLLSFNGNAWSKPGGVLALAGIKSASGGSASGQPVPYVTGGVLHLVGRAGADGHLLDVWQENGAWRHDDLTALGRDLAADMPGATYAPAVATLAGAPLVVFRAVRGELWTISRADNAPTNLTRSASAKLAVGHPAVITIGTQPHVIYRGQDRLIYDLFLDSGQWRVRSVCTDMAAADPVAATNGTIGLVVFRGRDNAIRVARLDGTGWTCQRTPAMQSADPFDGGILV